MQNADQTVGRQTERPSALSNELLAILTVGAMLLVVQINTCSILRADIADLRDDVVSLRQEFRTTY